MHELLVPSRSLMILDPSIYWITHGDWKSYAIDELLCDNTSVYKRVSTAIMVAMAVDEVALLRYPIAKSLAH